MIKHRKVRLQERQTKRKRLLSPLTLIGFGVTLLVVLGAAAFFIVPRIQSHADSVNTSCSLLVPANPLSAQGLATPYVLSATDPNNGPCNEANANQSAFVQAVIYNRSTGAFSVYNPLVIDQGTQPAVVPTAPTLPQGAIIGVWFGFNGDNLTLQGSKRNTLAQANCVNGSRGSIFGQFSYCNAQNFFTAANRGIASGKVTVPALGTAKDGQACPTVRDFMMIDQDQSDNVQTQYLANANGQTAQFSAANQGQLQNPTLIANPSDNALLTNFINPALGCQDWQAPDLADNNAMVSTLALDELQAAAGQKAPIALVPLNDPMTMNGNNQSLNKTNLYRAGVDQPAARSNKGASGTTYCQNYLQTGLPRLQLDQPLTVAAQTPDAGAANSLFTFLMQRWMQSYDNLNCGQLLNIPNPVTIQTDGNGVAIGATVATQTSPAGGTPAAPTATPADGAPAMPTATPADGAPAMPTATPADGATPPDGN